MAGASNRRRLIKIDWPEFGVASCPPISQAGLGLPAGTVSIQNFMTTSRRQWRTVLRTCRPFPWQ